MSLVLVLDKEETLALGSILSDIENGVGTWRLGEATRLLRNCLDSAIIARYMAEQIEAEKVQAALEKEAKKRGRKRGKKKAPTKEGGDDGD